VDETNARGAINKQLNKGQCSGNDRLFFIIRFFQQIFQYSTLNVVTNGLSGADRLIYKVPKAAVSHATAA
jgi:hypothetical protein